jgi:hypothetical protein
MVANITFRKNTSITPEFKLTCNVDTTLSIRLAPQSLMVRIHLATAEELRRGPRQLQCSGYAKNGAMGTYCVLTACNCAASENSFDSCGHRCMVVATSMIPRKPGEGIRTDRRDSQKLTILHRSEA